MDAKEFIKNNRQRVSWTVLTFVLLCCLGVFVSWQAKNAAKKRYENISAEQTRDESYELKIEELEKEVVELSGEISELRLQYDSTMESFSKENADFFRAIDFYNSSIEKYSKYSGCSKVSGAGIEISIDDGNTQDKNVSQYMLVHDTTLLNIINELRISGAVAISVNGERIVADSEVLCTGTGIRVNGKKLFAPFTITAIGDSSILYDGFVSSSVYKNIRTAKILCTVTKNNLITINAFSGEPLSHVSRLRDAD